MRTRRNVGILLWALAVISSCFILCANIGPILNYLCEQDSIIAELDAENNRMITISAESCWEIGRALYYEVRDQGVIVSPKFLLAVDDGSERHSYSLIYTENDSIVGVLDTTASPARLVAVYDFRWGQTWPRHGIENMRSRIRRLKEENPEIDAPYFEIPEN